MDFHKANIPIEPAPRSRNKTFRKSQSSPHAPSKGNHYPDF